MPTLEDIFKERKAEVEQSEVNSSKIHIENAIKSLSDFIQRKRSTTGLTTLDIPNSSPVGNANVGQLDSAMQFLINKESGGRTVADNPKSTAFGLGQLLRGNRERYAAKLGISNPDTVDYHEQLAMMEAYVSDRYGTPEKAVEFWKQHGWY